MEILILTGMSGAGKSTAANYLEDMGFFCIDNLPPRLLPDLIKAYAKNAHMHGNEAISRMAFVIDIRSSKLFDDMIPAINYLKQSEIDYRILYLDATDEALVSRYKQSRRNHPLAKNQGIAGALDEERDRLAPVKEIADDVIDTSTLAQSELRDMLYDMLSKTDRDERMTILVQSFGFKYGLPVDCDCVLDVRFIPNPFYIETLKPLSGLDQPVVDYVMQHDETNVYMDKQIDLFKYIIPYYVREGKVRLTIGVGCTGGRHRSVAMAVYLANRLQKQNLRVVIDHRDLHKDTKNKRELATDDQNNQLNDKKEG